jgi:hypothetical protein
MGRLACRNGVGDSEVSWGWLEIGWLLRTNSRSNAMVSRKKGGGCSGVKCLESAAHLRCTEASP